MSKGAGQNIPGRPGVFYEPLGTGQNIPGRPGMFYGPLGTAQNIPGRPGMFYELWNRTEHSGTSWNVL